MLLQTNTFVNSYNGQTKWMYFLIEDYDLLEKYNTTLDKVSADLKKEFESEPVYKNDFLKTKIKSRANEVTSFYDKKIPKVDSSHLCLAVISLVLLSRKITIIIHKSFKNVNILRKK